MMLSGCWLGNLCAHLQAVSFTLVDQVVSLIMSLHGTQKLSPKLLMDKRPVVSRMVKKLFRYLHADLAICHVRAVSLIWSIDSMSRPHEVESIIAQSMCSPELKTHMRRTRLLEYFGDCQVSKHASCHYHARSALRAASRRAPHAGAKIAAKPA
ncbi:hypothetical protein P692DRAFT_20916663, partial [Suillus brevipes Sb2]